MFDRLLSRVRRSRWTTAVSVIVAVAVVCLAASVVVRHPGGSSAVASPEAPKAPAATKAPPVTSRFGKKYFAPTVDAVLASARH